MNSDEIHYYLKHLPVNSFGVYASDCLPVIIPPLSAIVVNTDPHTHKGTHWVAFFRDVHGRLEYFDSYGNQPTVYDHIRFIRRNISCCYFYNPNTLQSIDSSVCGLYCLSYLYFRSLGFQMNDFTSLFSDNVNRNDSLVVMIFKHLYAMYNF